MSKNALHLVYLFVLLQFFNMMLFADNIIDFTHDNKTTTKQYKIGDNKLIQPSKQSNQSSHYMQRRNNIGGCNSDEVKRQIHVLETWLDI